MIIFIALIFSFCQDPTDKPIVVNYPTPIIGFSNVGELLIREMSTIGYAPFFPSEPLLENDKFISELVLNEDQRSGINDLKKRTIRFRKEFSQRNPISVGEETPESIVTEYRKFGNEVTKEYYEILQPRQKSRAREINSQLTIRMLGYVRFLSDKVAISGNEKRRLKQRIQQLSRSLPNDIDSLNRSFLDNATKCLTDTQLELFREASDSQSTISDLLILSIEGFFAGRESSDEHIEKTVITDPIQVVANVRFMQWSHEDANWILVKTKLTDTQSVLVLADLLCTDRPLAEFVDISDQQTEKLSALIVELREQSRQIDNDYSRGRLTSDRKLLVENLRTQRINLDEYAKTLISEILEEPQKEPIALFIDNRKLRRISPVLALLQGHYDEKLGIAGRQKVTVEKDIEFATKKLREKISAIEERFLDEIKSTLGENSKEEFENRIGRRIDFVYPSLLQLKQTLAIPLGY